MGYATLSMVKERLGIPSDDTTKDTVLTNAIAYADGYIDSRLSEVDGSVPSPTPQIIKDASADIAAYYYIRNLEPDRANIYLENGKMLLESYIRQQYFKGVTVRTGQDV